MRVLRTLLLMIALASGCFPLAARAQALVADLSSHLVAITTGFAGTDVLLFGAVEGPGDVVVVVRGPDEREIVRLKGRVAGIYVNRKEMAFSRVPSFYQVAASGELDKIASAAERARLEIGTENLRLVPEVERDPATVADYRAALIRNKEAQGLWGRNVAKVASLGARLFRVNVYFPSNVPVGIYQVQVFLFHDGEVRAAQTTPLSISKVGASAEIFDFAHREAAAYGAIAIAIALAAGWAASAIFRRV
ncbi:MAG TPA: TIGR02186 family protein [Alphaproteobacteria bacterium]